MTMKNNSLTFRISVITLGGVLLTLFIAAMVLYWSFQTALERNLHKFLSANIDILISATRLNEEGNITTNTNIRLFDNLPYYWQIESNNMLVAHSPSFDMPLSLSPVKGGKLASLTLAAPNNRPITAIQRTVNFPNHHQVNYVFGVSQHTAETLIMEERQYFLNIVITVSAILFLAFLIITLIQIKLSIQPFSRIKEAIEKIRSGDLEKLPADFPKEIRPLTQEINALLDYSSGIIERYRTFSANLSHSLKTPLTVLKNESHKTKSSLAILVREKSDLMLHIIERNLARVQVAHTTKLLRRRIPLNDMLNRMARTFGKLHEKDVTISCAETTYVYGDEGDFFEALGNLIENACKYGRHSVKVTATENSHIVITIEDDGKGIPKSKYSDVLERGIRLDETKAGNGIGLPIAKDILELYDGTVALSKSETLGGLAIVITLPKE